MGALVLWWLLLEAFGLITLPIVFALFGRRSAHGYPFSRILGLLLITWVAWLAGYVIPYGVALWGAIVLLAAVSGLVIRQRGEALVAWLRQEGWGAIVRFDALWTIGFLFFAWQRALHPEIFQQEKFMDFAFFNLLARTDTMPPEDPWMSGHVINYYYFGYLMFANLARLAPLATAVSYNLCVATIAGLAFSQSVAVTLQLTRRWGLGILGGVSTVLLGNLDGFLQVWEREGALRGMNFWRSSRVVGDDATINEFPFFSILHGDLHPHFMVLPVSILFLGVLLDRRLFPGDGRDVGWTSLRGWAPFAVAAFVLGSMVGISNWELPIGALLLALLAGRRLPLLPLFSRERIVLAVRVLVALVLSYLLFLPFYLSFDPPLGGVGVRLATTRLNEFLTVFGYLLFAPLVLVAVRLRGVVPRAELRHFLLALALLLLLTSAMSGNAVLPLLALLVSAAFVVAYRDTPPADRAGYLLLVAAGAALLACEVVFIRDSYGERLYRMNTVFKLYFQAWVVLAVTTPWAIGRLLERWPVGRSAGIVFRAAMVSLLVASACYPLGITLNRLGRAPTLDGNRYLERAQYEADYAAIRWLRQNASGQPVVLEATGNPYSYFSRIASNTGLPTVLGWGNHEGLWRGHTSEVAARAADVRRIYEARSLEEVRPLLEKYDVRYVVVGSLERQQHPRGVDKFGAFEKVFEEGNTAIYRRE